MSRSLGARLTPALLDLLSQRDLSTVLGRVVPVVTVDASGLPHPMLCSYLELRALEPGMVRMVLGASSRSAANLEARRGATLLLVDEARTNYVKCQATGPPLCQGALARFDLAVQEVLEDAPAAWETGLRITRGLCYEPAPALDSAEARAVLALLGST
jgi:flavin reductase (DIM6/NTAB) family NADH-FMN oxidoreductase RutF